MKIALGNDHRGNKTKEEIKNFLLASGHEVKDYGCSSEESCDYPDYARLVAEGVARGNYDCGILFCATGIGMSIAANKIPGIRAALCLNKKMARFSREHNNANILCLSADILSLKRIKGIVEVWLMTEFAGGRHERRVNRISEIEKDYLK